MALPPHDSGSYGKNRQVLAGADVLIQLIGRKVIVGKNSRTYFKEILSMKPMEPETQGKLKYGVCGLVCGAVIAMIIGIARGGWTTSQKIQMMTRDAVLASQAAICVAQFMKDPNHGEKLKEIEKLAI